MCASVPGEESAAACTVGLSDSLSMRRSTTSSFSSWNLQRSRSSSNFDGLSLPFLDFFDELALSISAS